MKTKLLITFILLTSIVMTAQVGVNNADPKATLDVTATNTGINTAEGIIAPRLTGNQIKSKDAQYGADQTGAIIYASSAAAPSSPKTINITKSGYYYFNGAIWIPMGEVDNDDTTDDAWINNAGVVNMGTLADGTTTRTTNQQFTFKDNGSATFGSSLTTYPSKLTLVNNASGNPLNDNLELASFGPVEQLSLEVYPIIDISSAVGTETAPVNFPNSVDNPIGVGEIRWNAHANGVKTRLAHISVDYAGDGFTNEATMNLYTGENGDQANGITIDEINNVGVGLESPTNKLHVTANADPLRLEGLQTGAASEEVLTVDGNGVVSKRALNATPAGDTTNDAWVNNGTRVELGTSADGTDRQAGAQFVALDNGNVGIGLNTPTSKLSVNGSFALPIREASGNVLDSDYTILGTGNVALPSPNGRFGRIYNFVYDGTNYLVNGRIRWNGTNYNNVNFRINNTDRRSFTVQSNNNYWIIIQEINW